MNRFKQVLAIIESSTNLLLKLNIHERYKELLDSEEVSDELFQQHISHLEKLAKEDGLHEIVIKDSNDGIELSIEEIEIDETDDIEKIKQEFSKGLEEDSEGDSEEDLEDDEEKSKNDTEENSDKNKNDDSTDNSKEQKKDTDEEIEEDKNKSDESKDDSEETANSIDEDFVKSLQESMEKLLSEFIASKEKNEELATLVKNLNSDVSVLKKELKTKNARLEKLIFKSKGFDLNLNDSEEESDGDDVFSAMANTLSQYHSENLDK